MSCVRYTYSVLCTVCGVPYSVLCTVCGVPSLGTVFREQCTVLTPQGCEDDLNDFCRLLNNLTAKEGLGLTQVLSWQWPVARQPLEPNNSAQISLPPFLSNCDPLNLPPYFGPFIAHRPPKSRKNLGPLRTIQTPGQTGTLKSPGSSGPNKLLGKRE